MHLLKGSTPAATFVGVQGINPLYSTVCGGGTITAQLIDAHAFTRETLMIRFYGATGVQEMTATSLNGVSGATANLSVTSLCPFTTMFTQPVSETIYVSHFSACVSAHACIFDEAAPALYDSIVFRPSDIHNPSQHIILW